MGDKVGGYAAAMGEGAMTSNVDADALLAAIFGATDAAVQAIDPRGTILAWNPGAEALFGYSAAEMVGSGAARLLPGDSEWASSLGRVFATARSERRESVRIRKDGSTLTVSETLSPVHDPDGRVVAVASIAHDVTERVLMERSLSEASREIERKNDLLERSNAELEQFAYVASHDLSEPLRAVAGMVGLLERRYRGRFDEDADEFIAFAIDGCERMRAMIEDLLAFSRAGRLDLHQAPVDTEDLVQQVLVSLSDPVAAASAVVATSALPTVEADARQLANVFQNLVSNALKFSRAGVVPEISISAARVEDGWRFEVADNGIGIDPQYHERIFRMFQRLHPRDEFPGTGIGLAIAERVVARHGGAMGVTANDAGGATFWFTIPDHAPEDAP